MFQCSLRRRKAHSHELFGNAVRLLYHEAKMLACKGIFAKPSITQPRNARSRTAAKLLLCKSLADDYNIKLTPLGVSGALRRAFSIGKSFSVSMFAQVSKSLILVTPCGYYNINYEQSRKNSRRGYAAEGLCTVRGFFLASNFV